MCAVDIAVVPWHTVTRKLCRYGVKVAQGVRRTHTHDGIRQQRRGRYGYGATRSFERDIPNRVISIELDV